MPDEGSVGVVFDLNAEELFGVIADYKERGGNLRDVAESARAIMKTAVDDLFDTEGNGQWKRSKRAEEEGGKTLQDTDLLAQTIDTEAGDDWVLVGSNVPHGKFHLPPEKSGHEVTMGIMPVRDWLAIDEDEVMDDIADLMLDHLIG